ncbi:nuclear transport factor 2 family protein [Achromobacter sp. GbtcB20]|uniref:nuclear transport factor 2 family protein n=1 Tax=Achromobacter sp. GbtcB20 TaxID=2824765 RepID=UPI001266B929|nr:nuclear transport factor 2 family protein [Achromobacter sp. GbtcB20]
MSNAITRPALIAAVDAFIQAWQSVPARLSLLDLSEEVELVSSHRAAAQGRNAVTAWLAAERSSFEALEIAHSNPVLAATEDEGVVGAYFYGQGSASQGRTLAFGGVLLLTVKNAANAARITRIQIQMNWTEGDLKQTPDWAMPVMRRLWEPGDTAPAIVSELDAPWRHVPQSNLTFTDVEAIANAWYRYAWALDQADYSLFDAVFTADATAELTPMGTLAGKHTLVGTLKAFRMPWPWMKHYGEPISIEHDGSAATMIMGRLIPGRTRTESGKRLFGAHYKIGARKTAGQGWQINEMRYVPGWVEVE